MNEMKMILRDILKCGLEFKIDNNDINQLEEVIKQKKSIDDLNHISTNIIKNKFRATIKDSVFEFDNLKDSRFEKGFHSLVLYCLGMNLSNLFEQRINDYLNPYGTEISVMQSPFEYVWRLTSFYHDVMTKFEKKEKDIIFEYLPYIHCPLLTVESFLNTCHGINFNGIKHTIYKDDLMVDLITKDLKTEPFEYTYRDNAEDVVNRYFRKRLHMDSLDHGIISGYVFYNQLVCSYLKHLNDYQMGHANHKVFEDFCIQKDNVIINYRPIHLLLFKFIADAIIVHNIWHYDSKTKKEYRLWCLDELSNKNRLTLNDNPIAFMLGFLDTIEPTKYFSTIKPCDVLSSIDIEFYELDDGHFKIVIGKTVDSNTIDFDDWYKHKLANMKSWLDLKVSYKKGSKKIIITIPVS